MVDHGNHITRMDSRQETGANDESRTVYGMRSTLSCIIVSSLVFTTVQHLDRVERAMGWRWSRNQVMLVLLINK